MKPEFNSPLNTSGKDPLVTCWKQPMSDVRHRGEKSEKNPRAPQLMNNNQTMIHKFNGYSAVKRKKSPDTAAETHENTYLLFRK